MIEKAVFGAGCFWHVEEDFRKLKGVIKTTVGYMGGKLKDPSYEEVCSDETGHVEVCKVEFDNKIISYEKLVEKFWKMHNPTQLNRQGLDIGSQYKSVIFYYNEKQKKLAMESKKKEQENYDKKIVTKILKVKNFYEAEAYHQKYLKKKGRNVC